MEEADRRRQSGRSDIGRKPTGRHGESRVQNSVERMARATFAPVVETRAHKPRGAQVGGNRPALPRSAGASAMRRAKPARRIADLIEACFAVERLAKSLGARKRGLTQGLDLRRDNRAAIGVGSAGLAPSTSPRSPSARPTSAKESRAPDQARQPPRRRERKIEWPRSKQTRPPTTAQSRVEASSPRVRNRSGPSNATNEPAWTRRPPPAKATDARLDGRRSRHRSSAPPHLALAFQAGLVNRGVNV